MTYQVILSGGVLDLATGQTIKRDLSSPDWQAYREWLKAGNAPLPPDLPEPQLPALSVADFDIALSDHLDSVAKARRYDNRITCMVRAGFPGPFQAEAIAFATWVDACNVTAYTLLAEVQAGARPLPETTQALIDVLPTMEWPA